MEVESTGAEALPEHAETQRPPRRPSPISLARQPSAQWDSKDEGASGARRDSKESPASAERRDSKESPASGTPQRRLSAAIKRKLTPAPQRSYDFFDIDDEYMRLEEEGNISERAPFPAQDETRCPVFNPNANWRLGWDGYMLVLVTFVFFVTPFEIAFVNRGEYWDGLWTMNRLVDLSFFGDMVLTFNTGYYNWRENRWYIERSHCNGSSWPSTVPAQFVARASRVLRHGRRARSRPRSWPRRARSWLLPRSPRPQPRH